MTLAIVLLVIIVASVAFHLWNPWMLTELASNWGSMDAMLNLSFIVTGVVFVLVTLFIVVAIIRYRHREGHRAQFEPDNRKLEWWLLGITTVGIAALLAPGLVVYNDFVQVPDDAMEVEVLGEQWQFSYRYPGADGSLGRSDVRLVSGDNPMGIDPDDPASQDDVTIVGHALRLPVDRPVKVLLRSKDVLHNFFVPQFRAKMDMVPGMVTQFWFTPTRTGRFEVLCAQHCGVSHFNMRSHVVVMEQDEFDEWLAAQQTFGDSVAALADRVEDEDVARGRELAGSQGCIGCHSVDGSRRVGPTWLGLYGSEVTMNDGSTVVADDEYIIRSIRQPAAQITAGFANVMPAYDFDDDQLSDLIAYIRSLAQADDAADAAESAEPEADATADTTAEAADAAREPTAEWGRKIAESNGCFACHNEDGSQQIGPSFLGLYQREVELEDGSTVTADADYIRRSVRDPNAQLTAGFAPAMPHYDLSDDELDALISYFREEMADD